MRTTQPPDQPYDDDEIDLRQLVGVLWRRKGMIATIALGCAALGAGASLLSTRYVSEGLFFVPKTSSPDTQNKNGAITLDAFKRYESAFSSAPRLAAFLDDPASDQGPARDALRRLGDSPVGLGNAIKPEFAFTDKDAKAFGIKASASDTLSGVRLQYESPEPSGGAPILLLAEYLRDTVIRVDMETISLEQCAKHRAREQELRNEQIAGEFDIAQEEKRIATLRDIITRTPDAAAIDNRQIVSLEKGSERFLSPAAQLVAAEIKIADMKLDETRRERDRISSALKRDYYCQAQKALQQPTTGRAFLDELKNIQTSVFHTRDMSSDIVEQTWNQLDVERENWTNTYLQSMRFLASPEGTEQKQRRPGLTLGVVLGGMVGSIFGVMLAFAHAWWRNNRDKITAKPKP